MAVRERSRIHQADYSRNITFKTILVRDRQHQLNRENCVQNCRYGSANIGAGVNVCLIF
jgi:hypothetical protein